MVIVNHRRNNLREKIKSRLIQLQKAIVSIINCLLKTKLKTRLMLLTSFVLSYFYLSYKILSHIKPVPTTIPKLLWFTSEDDILQSKKPKLYYDNVMKTINAYRSAWNDPYASARVLDNSACERILNEVDPRLTNAFRKEDIGAYKGDICRLGALYVYGGYYFDVDMEVVSPVHIPRNVLFSTARDADFGWFFNSFMASSPKHPILEIYINITIEFYDPSVQSICGRAKDKRVLGPCLLYNSYAEYLDMKGIEDSINLFVGESDNENILLLQERPVDKNDASDNGCGYEVVDRKKGIRHFFSRIPGTGICADEIKDIPKILWFTNEFLSHVDRRLYRDNIMKISAAYKKEWESHNVDVRVLDKKACIDILDKVETELKRAFISESNSAFRSEYCRIGALFLHGGYSFDLDLDVVKPFTLPSDVTFSTTLRDGLFTLGFIASTSGHPILDSYVTQALSYFLASPSQYCVEIETKGIAASCLLKEAFDNTPESKRYETYNLMERAITHPSYKYEIFDPNNGVTFFNQGSIINEVKF